jgi:hypothetical protein
MARIVLVDVHVIFKEWKMKLKFVAAAAVSAVMLGSGAANATTTALGAAVVGTPLPFFGLVPVFGPFTDSFTFSLPPNGGSGYSVANFTLLPGLYNTALTTLSLWSNPDGVVWNGDEILIGTSSAPGGSMVGLVQSAQPAGNYALTVMGVANGTSGGIYTGAISVTAVPEPETYAMMLAGLAALGFLARRRQG